MSNINKPNKSDVGYAALKAAIGSIPLLGAAATEIFGLVISPPLEKRKVSLMNDLAERLKKLEEEKLIDFAELSTNEQFIDTISQAMGYAIKTSEAEKISAFQNAIINTALNEAPDKSKSQIFLNLIDRYTIWHVKILSFFDNPKKWFEKNNQPLPSFYMGSLLSGLKEAFPELKDEEMVDVIWSDLKSAGFHRTGDLKTMMTGDGILSERTTDLGKEFLQFISHHEQIS